jgi:hypothetical protein
VAQYKIQDAGFLDEMVKFMFYTNIKISWTILKLGDLGWVGHGMGMADEMISKKVLNTKFHNRPVGKPRTRWKDVVRWETAHTCIGNTRMEETSRRQRRMEASSEGDQCPEGGCSAVY